jgi:hypothetical protein
MYIFKVLTGCTDDGSYENRNACILIIMYGNFALYCIKFVTYCVFPRKLNKISSPHVLP